MLTGFMSSRNSPILTLDLRRRRAETRVAGLVLAAGACAVLLLGLTSWTGLFAGAGCLLGVGFGLWRAGWIGSTHRIVAAKWLADGGWQLRDTHETTFEGELSAGTRLARNSLWLQWVIPGGRRRSMLLAPGDLPPRELRSLAVRMRIEARERALPEAHRR
jgi:hypothetical protein